MKAESGMSEDSGYTKTPFFDDEKSSKEDTVSPDFAFVNASARIAVYDDLRSAPRILTIEPTRTPEYIENLASTIYDQARMQGGHVPYTVVREVSENFIHARFSEIIVSILDGGETIRFADQGPGISQKDKAQLPGFSSAIEPMKHYIRGVGSGLPIVKEYLSSSDGTITIEDNLVAGSVVTISLVKRPQRSIATERTSTAPKLPLPVISDRGREYLRYFSDGSPLGVTDLVRLTGHPQSSVHNELKRLMESGLIEATNGRKRVITEYGYDVATSL